MLPIFLLEMTDQWSSLILPLMIKSCLLLSIPLLATFLMRSASASTRHLLLVLGIISLLLLPIFNAALPSLQIASVPDFNLGVETALRQPVSSGEIMQVAPGTTSGADSEPLSDKITPVLPAVKSSLPAIGWLFIIWVTGVLVLGSTLLGSLIRLRQLQREAVSVTGGGWPELLKTLGRELNLSACPELLCSPRALTPLTWGILRPVILLPRGCEEWTIDQRREVLLHELAHIQRRDCLTQFAAQLGCLIYWFNPLVWITTRQMRTERERACDDQVLMAGALPSSYASHLLKIAQQHGSGERMLSTGLAMARRSRIFDRLDAVLNPELHRSGPNRRLIRTALILTMAIVLPLAAISPRAGEQNRKNDRSESLVSTEIVSSGGRMTPIETGGRSGMISVEDKGYKLTMKFQGGIEFAANDTDVTWMEPEAVLKIEKKKLWRRKRFEVYADENGQISHTYIDGRTKKPYDKKAAAEFSQLLAVILVNSGINAEERVKRVYDDDGIEGVFALNHRIESDYTKAIYYCEALALGILNSQEVSRLLKRLPGEIESDYEKTSVLVSYTDSYLGMGKTHRAFLRCISEMESDYQKAEILKTTLYHGDLTFAELEVIFAALTLIRSDYESAGVLLMVNPNLLLDADARAIYYEAFDSINSDFEKAAVLTALARRAGDNEQLREICRMAADKIRSDHEYSRVARALRQDITTRINRALPLPETGQQ